MVLPYSLYTGSDLLKAIAEDEFLEGIEKDIEGVAERAFPYNPKEEAMLLATDFIANRQHIWRELGNIDITRQSKKYAGKEPLFIDFKHRELNPSVTPKDYLQMFKEYLKVWAYRMKTGNQERDWYKALNECANLIKNTKEWIKQLDRKQHDYNPYYEILYI